MSADDLKPIAINLEPSVWLRLEQLAVAREQTVDTLAAEAILYFIAHDEKLTDVEKAATESWGHYRRTGLHVTNDEVGAWLAELEAGNDDAEPPACHV